jgi:hypothetical protein
VTDSLEKHHRYLLVAKMALIQLHNHAWKLRNPEGVSVIQRDELTKIIMSISCINDALKRYYNEPDKGT